MYSEKKKFQPSVAGLVVVVLMVVVVVVVVVVVAIVVDFRRYLLLSLGVKNGPPAVCVCVSDPSRHSRPCPFEQSLSGIQKS